MKVKLTEVESLELVNVILKRRIAQQQLDYEKEKEQILYKKLIEKYNITGAAEVSEDGQYLTWPDPTPVPQELKKASLAKKSKSKKKKQG